jgi:hypothetical protein
LIRLDHRQACVECGRLFEPLFLVFIDTAIAGVRFCRLLGSAARFSLVERVYWIFHQYFSTWGFTLK